jgi:hypothetical protein
MTFDNSGKQIARWSRTTPRVDKRVDLLSVAREPISMLRSAVRTVRDACEHGYHECAKCNPPAASKPEALAAKSAPVAPHERIERMGEQAPFAVGDVVASRVGHHGLVVGRQYTVADAGVGYVDVSDGPIANPSEWFELVRRAEPAVPVCAEAAKAGLPAGWKRAAKFGDIGFERVDGHGGVWCRGVRATDWRAGPPSIAAGHYGTAQWYRSGFETAADAARYADEQIAAKERG